MNTVKLYLQKILAWIKQLPYTIAELKLAQSTNPDWLHIVLGYGFVMTAYRFGIPWWGGWMIDGGIAGALEAFDHHFERQPNTSNWRDVGMYVIGGGLAAFVIGVL